MNSQGKRNAATSVILILIVALGVLAVGTWVLMAGQEKEGRSGEIDTFEVRRGSFEIIIPTSGELAALRQIEIKNLLESRTSTIVEIIEEGTQVSKGDILVRFNDEDIKTNIKDAEDALDNEQNQLDNALANLEIRKKTRESELAKADLEITLTELALQSWEEGEVVETRQDLALEIKTAQMEYDRYEERFKASQSLLEKEFISLDEFKQDEIALVRAETSLSQAKLDIEIYEKYTHKQDREQKESDRKQAIDERDRIQTRYDAEVSSAESDVRSSENQVDSRQERLDKWKNQLELCVIKAPSDGLVVYATSLNSGGMHRGSNEDPPMVGTDVQSKKTIMVLPDISQMIAEVKVNEALSGLIKRGQRANIVSDAHADLTMTGEVYSVGVLAETGGWRDPNRRDYTVKILLDDMEITKDLKPSMRCQADINVDSVENSLYIPIQSIFRQGPYAYVWTPDGRGYSQSQVQIGQASEMYVEILEGIMDGDIVLMREPDPKEIVSTLNLQKSNGADGMGAEMASHQETSTPASHEPESHEPGMGMGGDSPRRDGGDRSGQGRPSREQMEEFMKNMTPEQRAEMEKRREAGRNQNGGGESSSENESESDGSGENK